MKKIIIVFLVITFLFYGSVMIINNAIAAMLKHELMNITRNENISVVDSFAKAGKYSGSGNGMQYRGVVIIESNRSLEKLRECYDKDGVEITSGDRAKDILKRLGYSKQISNNKEIYVVIKEQSSALKNRLIQTLLDFDIRAH